MPPVPPPYPRAKPGTTSGRSSSAGRPMALVMLPLVAGSSLGRPSATGICSARGLPGGGPSSSSSTSVASSGSGKRPPLSFAAAGPPPAAAAACPKLPSAGSDTESRKRTASLSSSAASASTAPTAAGIQPAQEKNSLPDREIVKRQWKKAYSDLLPQPEGADEELPIRLEKMILYRAAMEHRKRQHFLSLEDGSPHPHRARAVPPPPMSPLSPQAHVFPAFFRRRVSMHDRPLLILHWEALLCDIDRKTLWSDKLFIYERPGLREGLALLSGQFQLLVVSTSKRKQTEKVAEFLRQLQETADAAPSPPFSIDGMFNRSTITVWEPGPPNSSDPFVPSIVKDYLSLVRQYCASSGGANDNDDDAAAALLSRVLVVGSLSLEEAEVRARVGTTGLVFNSETGTSTRRLKTYTEAVSQPWVVRSDETRESRLRHASAPVTVLVPNPRCQSDQSAVSFCDLARYVLQLWALGGRAASPDGRIIEGGWTAAFQQQQQQQQQQQAHGEQCATVGTTCFDYRQPVPNSRDNEELPTTYRFITVLSNGKGAGGKYRVIDAGNLFQAGEDIGRRHA